MASRCLSLCSTEDQNVSQSAILTNQVTDQNADPSLNFSASECISMSLVTVSVNTALQCRTLSSCHTKEKRVSCMSQVSTMNTAGFPRILESP